MPNEREDLQEVASSIDSLWPSIAPSGLNEWHVGDLSGCPEGVRAAFALCRTLTPHSAMDAWIDPAGECGQSLESIDAAELCAVADVASHPRTRSRLFDVAWCAHPSAEAADGAVAAYLASLRHDVLTEVDEAPRSMEFGSDSDGTVPSDLFVAARLQRALRLACAAGNQENTLRCVRALIDQANSAIEGGKLSSSIRLLSIFDKRDWKLVADDANSLLGAVADGLFLASQTVAGAGTDLDRSLEQLAELAERLGAQSVARRAWQAIVVRRLLLSQDADIATRISFLAGARQIASDKGLIDLRRELSLQLWLAVRGELPAVDGDAAPLMEPDDPLVRVSEDELRGLYEEEVRRIIEVSPDVRSMMCSIGLRLPADLIEIEDQVHAEFESGTEGISAMLRSRHLGSREHFAVTRAERERSEVVWRAELGASRFAEYFLVPAFNAVLGELSDGPGVLAGEILEHPVVDAVAAARIESAFALYRTQDYDAAVHLGVPVIERVLRGFAYVARRLEPPVARSGSDGEPKSLWNVLESLEGVLPESNRRWLRFLLVETPGPNLRNTVAHGEGGRSGEGDSLLVLHAFASLSCLRRCDHPPAASEL